MQYIRHINSWWLLFRRGLSQCRWDWCVSNTLMMCKGSRKGILLLIGIIRRPWTSSTIVIIVRIAMRHIAWVSPRRDIIFFCSMARMTTFIASCLSSFIRMISSCKLGEVWQFFPVDSTWRRLEWLHIRSHNIISLFELWIYFIRALFILVQWISNIIGSIDMVYLIIEIFGDLNLFCRRLITDLFLIELWILLLMFWGG